MEFESEQMNDYSNRPSPNFGFIPDGERKIQPNVIDEINENAASLSTASDSPSDPEVDLSADPPPVEPMTEEDMEVSFEIPQPDPTAPTSVLLSEEEDKPLEASVIFPERVSEDDDESLDLENIIIEDFPEDEISPFNTEESISEDIFVEFTPPSLEIKLDTPQARLKYWIESSFDDASEFCRIAEINKSSFYEYFSAYSPIIGGQLANKLERLGLNLEWYRTGKGPMFKELTQPKTVSDSQRKFSVRKKNSDIRQTEKNSEPEVKVPVNKNRVKRIMNKKSKEKPAKSVANKSKKPIVYDLNTPQGRLKKWINDNFVSVTEFSKIFGSQPSAIYNHTCTNGFLYKKDNLKKLESMGLDINWYLGSLVNEVAPVKSSTFIEKTGDPIHNVKIAVETPAPKSDRKKYAKRSAEPAPPIIAAPLQSFGTMLTEYETQEVKLLEEKERIDGELARIQAIKLHLSELSKLMNF